MLRIGLVGAGAIARDHLLALREVRGGRLVGVADVALERRASWPRWSARRRWPSHSP
jgi:predicted dehydrogenase